MVKTPKYSDVETDSPTAFISLLMQIAHRFALRADSCGIPFY
jgi:hypothetical protein